MPSTHTRTHILLCTTVLTARCLTKTLKNVSQQWQHADSSCLHFDIRRQRGHVAFVGLWHAEVNRKCRRFYCFLALFVSVCCYFGDVNIDLCRSLWEPNVSWGLLKCELNDLSDITHFLWNLSADIDVKMEILLSTKRPIIAQRQAFLPKG